jgi:hypothetical protein
MKLNRSHDFLSHLPQKGWLTYGQGLKALRTAGRVLDSLSSPHQSRTQCSTCSPPRLTPRPIHDLKLKEELLTPPLNIFNHLAVAFPLRK